MTPASITDTAARILKPRHRPIDLGSLSEELSTMTAYAGEVRGPYTSQIVALHDLAQALTNADPDRVAEIAAAALLRLHELAPVDGPAQPAEVLAGDTPAVYIQPRVITIRSVRDGDEIATFTADGYLVSTLRGLANADATSGVTWHTVDLASSFEGVTAVTCADGREWRLNSYSDVIIREIVGEPR